MRGTICLLLLAAVAVSVTSAGACLSCQKKHSCPKPLIQHPHTGCYSYKKCPPPYTCYYNKICCRRPTCPPRWTSCGPCRYGKCRLGCECIKGTCCRRIKKSCPNNMISCGIPCKHGKCPFPCQCRYGRCCKPKPKPCPRGWAFCNQKCKSIPWVKKWKCPKSCTCIKGYCCRKICLYC